MMKLKEWINYELNLSIPELIVLIIVVFALLFIQGWMSANDAEQYEYELAQKERTIDSMTGVRDCKFTGGKHHHIWKDACFVGEDEVVVTR